MNDGERGGEEIAEKVVPSREVEGMIKMCYINIQRIIYCHNFAHCLHFRLSGSSHAVGTPIPNQRSVINSHIKYRAQQAGRFNVSRGIFIYTLE